MTPRGERAKSFLRGLLKFAGLIAVAGAIGAAIGMGLAQLSGDGGPDALEATTTAPPNPRAAVRVSVVDARLFTDETPSGVQEQRARMTVRIQAQNTGGDRVTLRPPILRVGNVRVPADPAGDQVDPLEPTGSQTVTLRFALAGEATPKVVRDRRARLLVAGQSLAMRVKIRPPTR